MRRFCLLVGLVVGTVCQSVLSQATPDNGRAIQLQARLQTLQQIETDNRFLANPDIPPGQRLFIDYGGYFAPQYYSIDDFEANNHGYWQYQLVGYLRVIFDGANEIFMRLSTEYNDYNDGDSFDGFGSRLINPDFDRAFYKFDLQRYMQAYYGKTLNYDLGFEGGRDLVYWGNGLVIGQTLDGVMPSASWGKLSLGTVFGITPLRTVDFQPDRPAFDYNTKRGFYGGMLSVALDPIPIHPYVYGLVQRDYNTENQSLTNGIVTNYGYDSDYIGFGATGSVNDFVQFGIEGVYETGRSLSNSFAVEGFQLVQVPQTWDNISAWAGDVKVDYAPQDEHQSRLSIEGIVATGDPDRGLTNTTFNGNAPNTTDRAFNAFGLVSTGLAFGAPVSNLAIMRCGASTFPMINIPAFRRFQAGMDLYWINKENAQAPIDEPTVPGVTYLGWEPDFYVNYQIFSDITLTFRYGVFMPNAKAFQTDKARQFFYGGANIAF